MYMRFSLLPARPARSEGTLTVLSSQRGDGHTDRWLYCLDPLSESTQRMMLGGMGRRGQGGRVKGGGEGGDRGRQIRKKTERERETDRGRGVEDGTERERYRDRDIKSEICAHV